jgi:hypothetical protein
VQYEVNAANKKHEIWQRDSLPPCIVAGVWSPTNAIAGCTNRTLLIGVNKVGVVKNKLKPNDTLSNFNPLAFLFPKR